MGFFKYPYTDLNELNLDWVIAKIKYIEQASHILYDNSGTGLVANNVQDAIDEIIDMISSQGVVSFNGRSGIVLPVSGDYTASMIPYTNTVSGLTAADVQNAIDEVDANLDSFIATPKVDSFNTRTGNVVPAASDYDADQIDYDNTTSGMIATDVQGAIDEIDDRLDNFNVAASQVSYDNTVSGLTATDAQAAIDEIANDVLSSGVASFNGRTGAVNPQAGDYDASDITYDNTVSGLTATDGQAAIDELSADITGKYGYVETHTISKTGSMTWADKLKALCDDILTYIQGIGNDEIVAPSRVTLGNDDYYLEKPDNYRNNSITGFGFNAFHTDVSANTCSTRELKMSTTLANNYNIRVSFDSAGAIAYSDATNNTSGTTIYAYLKKYKKLK